MSTIIGLVSTFRLPLQKSGGLDVEAAGRHEEVQKERKKERNWTLREETALARSKREVNACRIGL